MPVAESEFSFRIGKRQLVAGCRFELMFLNRQLGSESAKSRVGYGWVGFAWG